MVTIKLKTNTLAILIAGLYSSHTGIDPIAIPESLYLELAEKVEPFMENWDYSKISFEDWIKHCLMIYPSELIADEDIKELKNNEIYFERENGPVTLIVTAKMIL